MEGGRAEFNSFLTVYLVLACKSERRDKPYIIIKELGEEYIIIITHFAYKQHTQHKPINHPPFSLISNPWLNYYHNLT